MATRAEMFAHYGLIQVVEPATAEAYKKVAEEQWRSEFTESPHGEPWHTSIHASRFPADSPGYCPRKQQYELMNIPKPRPHTRAGLTVMAAGFAIEEELVSTWQKAGILLSLRPEKDKEQRQTGFRHPRYWLTGSTDGVIHPKGWDRGHVVEVKSKDHDVVLEMRRGERSFDDGHRRQLLIYIWLANQASPFLWPKLKPVVSGSIYYLSRNQPHITHEFFFRLDEEAVQMGLDHLTKVREAYLAGELLPRPASFGSWQEGECKFCELKNLTLNDKTKVGCKADLKREVTRLEDSSTIEFAKELNENYDYEETRKEVLDRWQ